MASAYYSIHFQTGGLIPLQPLGPKVDISTKNHFCHFDRAKRAEKSLRLLYSQHLDARGGFAGGEILRDGAGVDYDFAGGGGGVDEAEFLGWGRID